MRGETATEGSTTMIPRFGAYPQGPNSTFVRVWAPNAKAADVIGDFSNWKANTKTSLTPQPDGFWEGVIQGLKADGRYEFLITKGNNDVKHRMDPAARDTNDSDLGNKTNKSIVVDPARKWSDFKTPPFDDLINYQCHVGSFVGYGDGLGTKQGVARINDVAKKLGYINQLGFNAIELLPVQEFRANRSWGYNPAFYFAMESAYGRPVDFRAFVDACHKHGLAVLFDDVYNHISDDDSSFYHFDEAVVGNGRGYLGTHRTDWGTAPAFWEQAIRDFFLANMGMYLSEYNADGLRFDATRAIEAAKGWDADGWGFMQYLTGMGKQLFPGKYLVAEHVPDHETIVTSAGFHATWVQDLCGVLRDALNGFDPVNKIEALLGNSFGPGRAYPYSWNTVKYLLGSHDECGDLDGGRKGRSYFVERYGGRHNWYARAKARMAWALNVAIKGTPMLFMGNECHMKGYWHDGADANGDHRFDWTIAGDQIGMGMRRLVQAANAVRSNHVSLRNGNLEVTHRDYDNGVIAFKRWNDAGGLVLVVVNAGDTSFGNHAYGVYPGQYGDWEQILCSQDASFDGWDGAGNAYYTPSTQPDGKIYINVPKWSVTMFRLV